MNMHIAELQIALNPNDKRRILPSSIPDGKVLDLGCGAGQTLIATCADRRSFGLDVDFDALELGKTLTNKVVFVCGRGEALPFRDSSFDFVIARVSLPYMNIQKTLNEIGRVLKSGGQLWATLERLSLPFRTRLYKKARFYGLVPYLLVNTLLFHLFSKSIPFIDGEYRGFQTIVGLRRALQRAGFEQIKITKGLHLVAIAMASAPRNAGS